MGNALEGSYVRDPFAEAEREMSRDGLTIEELLSIAPEQIHGDDHFGGLVARLVDSAMSRSEWSEYIEREFENELDSLRKAEKAIQIFICEEFELNIRLGTWGDVERHTRGEIAITMTWPNRQAKSWTFCASANPDKDHNALYLYDNAESVSGHNYNDRRRVVNVIRAEMLRAATAFVYGRNVK